MEFNKYFDHTFLKAFATEKDIDTLCQQARELNTASVCVNEEWVAYCKETFNGAQSVINYLGKYTHRIAISNHRIKSMTEATVTYAVKDYKNKGQWKEKTVPGEEFIRRFLMHVPPKRFG